MSKKERFKLVTEYFLKHRSVAETELQYADPYELIVAVMLSAQCTDKRVNIITPAFFKQFPSVESLASAEEKDVLELVKSCSYPNSKTRHLIKMARMLIGKFNGTMPSDIEQLQELPGVGRKTANVIAAVIFNKPAMPVDTHVFRVSARIGLTSNSKTPLETEKQLIKYFPDHLIPIAHHWLILHGRYVCQARKPKCDECGLIDFCRYYEKLKGEKKKIRIKRLKVLK
ncbi:MAG: endonuclease III [Bacteroidales bacterium]|nr:endonuclease III [Bacteroidales bacterium]